MNLNASTLSNVGNIGYAAFQQSHITGTLTLSGSVNIGESAFFNSYLTGVDLSATDMTIIPKSCFYLSRITSALLPTTITKIGVSTFQQCTALTSIDLSSLTSLTELGENAFYASTNLVLTASDIQNISVFGNMCLRQTKLSGDLVLANVTSLGSDAFMNTLVSSCDFTGSTFTSLSDKVFSLCYSLDHLIVNASVTSIGKEIVQNCNNLRYIKFLPTSVPTANNNAFSGINNNTKIYVPDAALSDYQSAAVWSNYASKIFPMSQFATDFPNG